MKKKKILFIEDEPQQIMMVGMRLEANGYEVVSAMDGEDGLNKAYKERPDLILLDLIMPKLDGFTVCERLKKDPETRGIPIIVITAMEDKEVLERCRALGADDLIGKPFESKDLIRRIKSMVPDQTCKTQRK